MHLHRPPDSTVFEYIRLKLKDDLDTYISEPSEDELALRGEVRFTYAPNDV